jgi:hypothetical protein
MPGERPQLTSLIRTPDPSQDSMTVRSWYIPKAWARARARGLVPQTPDLQSFQMEDYLAGDR